MDKKKTGKEAEEKPVVYGNPEYSAKDDIYNHEEKESLDESGESDLPAATKSRLGEEDADLDVPGSELDDADEATGEEDEENNYYSLGGDSHDDLEEDKGE